MKHYLLWYSSVLILPIILVVWIYPTWYNGPSLFIAMMSTLLIGIPLLLLGAWVCSHIAKRYLAGT